MKDNNNNTEEAILKAAEQVFLDKGFAGAKTTEIARIAGVNHAMLHYYFRTKENLFEKVFITKAHHLASSFTTVFNEDIPFLEKIELAINRHFNFIMENPKLPIFIINVVTSDKEHKEKAKQIIAPALMGLFRQVQQNIDAEVEKGWIHPIKAIDLVLNIVSMNVFAFVFLAATSGGGNDLTFSPKDIQFLEERKQNNIRVILNDLKK